MNPQDQFVHIWRYEGGYKAIDENMKFLQDNKDYNLIMKDMSPLLRSRESELYLQFSFWPEVALRYFGQQRSHHDHIPPTVKISIHDPNPNCFREGSHVYELRSYHLKPGTMVEWSNYWAKAIKLRDYQHTEAYMGLFSQIGELYNVKVLVFIFYFSAQSEEASRKIMFFFCEG